MADLRSEFDQLLKQLNEIEEKSFDFADFMKNLEHLHLSETLALNIQVQLITKLANCRIFVPQNSLVAEQRVNGLLRYLASGNYAVCSLACSLMKIFCDFLDMNGQHIATQVMISCKNLLTIVTKAEDLHNYGLTICQSIALASMCSIATEWSQKLKQPNQWLPLALLALNTVFGVLLNKKMHSFVQQVAIEGLRRTVNIPNFWRCLTHTEQINALSHFKQLFDIQLRGDRKPDAFVLIKLFQTAANKDIALSACMSRILKDFLQVCLQCLPELIEVTDQSELDMDLPLDVRWMCLKFLWALLNGMRMQKLTYQDEQWEIYLERLKPLLTNGCASMQSTRKLKKDISCLISKLPF